MNTIRFSLDHYPPATGSIGQDSFRLREFIDDKNITTIEHELWTFLSTYALNKEPIKEFRSFPYIGSGWEWSVFKKNATQVIKIPAGIFPEVQTEEYLINSRKAYNTVCEFFDRKFIANTHFERIDNINTMTQDYISGKQSYIIGFATRNDKLIENLKVFITQSLTMLEKILWMNFV